jgi:heme A synthase
MTAPINCGPYAMTNFPLTKVMVQFLAYLVEIIAILFLIAGAVVAGTLAIQNQLDWLLTVLCVALGLIAGFVSSAIVLSVPLLALRMNQNLEEMNATLRAFRRDSP